jgi:hypothetical protein
VVSKDVSVDGEQGLATRRRDVGVGCRWYVRFPDAGMARCEQRGEPLTASQRFTLLTAGQLALGDWRAPIPERGDGDG